MIYFTFTVCTNVFTTRSKYCNFYRYFQIQLNCYQNVISIVVSRYMDNEISVFYITLYTFVKNSYGRRSNETKGKDMETLQFSLNLQLFSDSKIPEKDIELLRSEEINYYARYIYYLINIKFSLLIEQQHEQDISIAYSSILRFFANLLP